MYSLAEGRSGVQFGGGKVWCTVWRREALVYGLAEGSCGVQFGGGKVWCTVWRREALPCGQWSDRRMATHAEVPRPSRPRTTELGGTNITTGNTATTTNIANKRNKIKDKNENVS